MPGARQRRGHVAVGRRKARCPKARLLTPPTGRVEGRRACCRWRVSSPVLSIAGWVHNSTMATFPTPATSNAACGFPALRFPACFMLRVMGPITLGALSAVADSPDSCWHWFRFLQLSLRSISRPLFESRRAHGARSHGPESLKPLPGLDVL